MGISMVQALLSKYEGLADYTSTLPFVTYKYGSPPSSNEKPCLFRNASGDICIPPIVVLNDANIDSLGDTARFTDLCANVSELDLSHTCVSWPDILQVLNCCPKLTWLNLSQNKCLLNFPDEVEEPSSILSRLDTLVLNETDIQWKALAFLLKAAPNVSNIYLCNNGLTCIRPHSSSQNHCVHGDTSFAFPSVKILFFNGNKMQSFDDLVTLGLTFPSLEKLTLIDNGIEKLPDDTSFADKLANLVCLNLSENGISQYSEIDKLNSFESLIDVCLTEISLASNPELSESEFREEVIARLPNIETLNKTPISAEERCNAERSFIRRYMDSDAKPFQFEMLQGKHGKLEHLAEVDLRPPETIDVVIKYNEQCKLYSMPITFSVGEVKKTVCQEFSCSPTKCRLFHKQQGYFTEELKFPRRRFHSYKPDEGDELFLVDKMLD